MSMYRETLEKQDQFTLIIAPPELKNYPLLQPGNADKLFEIGYKKNKKRVEKQ